MTDDVREERETNLRMETEEVEEEWMSRRDVGHLERRQHNLGWLMGYGCSFIYVKLLHFGHSPEGAKVPSSSPLDSDPSSLCCLINVHSPPSFVFTL